MNLIKSSKPAMKQKFKVRKIHVYLMLVLLVLGFMVTYSVQFTLGNFNDITSARDSEWDKKVKLNEQILNEKQKNSDLMNLLQTLRSQVDSKEKELSKNQNVSSGVVNELDGMRMQAGLIPVTGPGIVVTLDDSKALRNNFDGTNSGIVHDQYIRDVVNELYAAGAEGISINDERLVTTSTVRCVGPTVTVNENKLAAPFVIKAIGNSNTLYSALYMPGGVVEMLRKKNIDITLKKMDKIDLPGFVSNKNKTLQ